MLVWNSGDCTPWTHRLELNACRWKPDCVRRNDRKVIFRGLLSWNGTILWMRQRVSATLSPSGGTPSMDASTRVGHTETFKPDTFNGRVNSCRERTFWRTFFSFRWPGKVATNRTLFVNTRWPSLTTCHQRTYSHQNLTTCPTHESSRQSLPHS